MFLAKKIVSWHCWEVYSFCWLIVHERGVDCSRAIHDWGQAELHLRRYSSSSQGVIVTPWSRLFDGFNPA